MDWENKKGHRSNSCILPGPANFPPFQAAGLDLGSCLAANGGAVHDADPIHVAQAPAGDGVAEGHRDGGTVHLPWPKAETMGKLMGK